MFPYILLVLGLLILATGIGFIYFGLKNYLKAETPAVGLFKKPLFLGWAGIDISSIGVLIALLGLVNVRNYTLTGPGRAFIIIGGLLTIGFLTYFVIAFTVHYYKPGVDPKSKKLLYWSLFASALGFLVSLVMMIEGFNLVGAIQYPLPQGIPFDAPIVRFYALFILSGAILVYFICDHAFFKKYGRHGILENVFYIAFPAGIVGARIWYVIGNWTRDGFDQDFMGVFRMWDGGLAIMGGALFGALAGILFFKFYRKGFSIADAADVIVPAILVAQSIGRWGNFMNQEVYGAVADPSKWWFLPSFIIDQMTVAGDFRVPLFLIESFINMTGYFVIRFAVGQGLKQWIKPADLALSYPLWYGITRAIMEPLRDPNYNMGDNNNWSYYWSFIFIGLAIVGIVVNHLYHASKKTPKVGQ